jgi:hypothetical protein
MKKKTTMMASTIYTMVFWGMLWKRGSSFKPSMAEVIEIGGSDNAV